MPYYSKYDDHYRALYAQGIKYWSDGPDHSKANIEGVISRIREVWPDPGGIRVLELGCGEGHLAVPLVRLGMEYLGVDYAPHAISRARMRAEENGLAVDFRVMDALRPDEEIAQRKYDLILDQACFHMLAVDRDRRRYLATVRQMMDSESAFILTNQAREEDAPDEEIHSVEEYERVFQHDLSGTKTWEAWDGEKWVTVALPKFACRAKSQQGYVREFTTAGFQIRSAYEVGSRQHALDFILTR